MCIVHMDTCNYRKSYHIHWNQLICDNIWKGFSPKSRFQNNFGCTEKIRFIIIIMFESDHRIKWMLSRACSIYAAPVRHKTKTIQMPWANPLFNSIGRVDWPIKCEKLRFYQMVVVPCTRHALQLNTMFITQNVCWHGLHSVVQLSDALAYARLHWHILAVCSIKTWTRPAKIVNNELLSAVGSKKKR